MRFRIRPHNDGYGAFSASKLTRSGAPPRLVRSLAHSSDPFSISIAGLAAALKSPLPIVLLWLGVVAKAGLILSVLPGAIRNYDFQCYYASALALRRGLDPYTIDYRPLISALRLNLTPDYRADYTPPLMLLLEPLTRLSIDHAFWVWTALNAVALAVALYGLLGTRLSGIAPRAAWILAALAMLYPPVGIHFLYAQTVIPILMLLVLAMRALERGHDAAAGTLIAVAAMLRAFPALLLIYLVVTRRWRALRWSLVAFAIGGVGTLAAMGPMSFDFFATIGWATRTVTLNGPTNLALGAAVSRIFWAVTGGPGTDGIELLRKLTVWGIEIALLAGAIRLTRSIEAGDPGSRGFSLWVILSIMLSPVVWPFYLVLLLMPYSQIITAAIDRRSSGRVLTMAVGSYLVIGIVRGAVSLSDALRPHYALLDQAPLISLLTAYAAAVWLIGEGRKVRIGAHVPASAAKTGALVIAN